MDEERFSDERVYWPIRLLKGLGRLPHEYSTFLWYGHTIPNGDPPEPYAEGTNLCCALITPPVLAPDDFELLEFDARRARSNRSRRCRPSQRRAEEAALPRAPVK
jgi:hypothetical protein